MSSLYNRRKKTDTRFPLYKQVAFSLVIIISLVMIVIAFLTPSWFRTIYIRDVSNKKLKYPVVCRDLNVRAVCLNVIECPVNYAFNIDSQTVCSNLSRYEGIFDNKIIYSQLFKILNVQDSVGEIDLMLIKVLFVCIIGIGISAPIPLIILNLPKCSNSTHSRRAKLITGCLLITSVVLSLMTLIVSNHLQYVVDSKCYELNNKMSTEIKELSKVCVIPDFWSQVFFSLGIFGFLFVGLVLLDRSELDNQKR